MRHRGKKTETKAKQDAGVVIANDADAERCFELLPLVTRKVRSHIRCFTVFYHHVRHDTQAVPWCWAALPSTLHSSKALLISFCRVGSQTGTVR